MKEIAGELSQLESDVLGVLWKNKKLKVRDIYTVLKKRRKVALTSIAVALDRIHKQGVTGRTISAGKGGLSYVYFPLKTRQEFEKGIMEKAVNVLLKKFGSTAISYFHDRFERKS